MQGGPWKITVVLNTKSQMSELECGVPRMFEAVGDVKEIVFCDLELRVGDKIKMFKLFYIFTVFTYVCTSDAAHVPVWECTDSELNYMQIGTMATRNFLERVFGSGICHTMFSCPGVIIDP